MKLLKYNEAAKRLNVPVGTLYGWVSEGRVPYFRFGARSVRFDEEVLDKWVCARASGAVEVSNGS